MRGEYFNVVGFKDRSMGSPPHTWRIQNAIKYVFPTLRITSTYVENTGTIVGVPLVSWDHLHIRGEYIHQNLHIMSDHGSPPHTWRIQLGVINTKLNQGITSTYVENTYRIWTCIFRQWDHLHIRGEYNNVIFVSRDYLGSPPHTWRIPALSTCTWEEMRITSTYVENTELKQFLDVAKEDHLHIRGEYMF